MRDNCARLWTIQMAMVLAWRPRCQLQFCLASGNPYCYLDPFTSDMASGDAYTHLKTAPYPDSEYDQSSCNDTCPDFIRFSDHPTRLL